MAKVLRLTENEAERSVKFVCFWERLANSGLQEIYAPDMERALALAKECYGSHCKITVYQVVGDCIAYGQYD
jgi:hypothetical protein